MNSEGVARLMAAADTAGFFGVAPQTQPAHIADPAAMAAVTAASLTDNSGGTASDTIADITEANNAGSADRVPTENAIASLAAEVNALVVDIAAAKTAIDANNAAIDSILSQLATLGLQAAS